MTAPVREDEEKQIIELLRVLRVSEGWITAETVTPQAGSAFVSDDSKSHPFELSNAVGLSISIAIDHLHCLRMALTGGGHGTLGLHTYAPFTLLRGAVENSAIAVWVMSPRNRTQRLERHLWHEVTSARKLMRTLELAGDRVAKDTSERLRRLLAIADAEGIERSKLKDDVLATKIVKEASKEPETGFSDDDTNAILMFWKLCSAFGHGDRGYLQLFDVEVAADQGHTDRSSAVVSAPTQLVLSGSRAAVAMIGAALRLAELRSTSPCP